MKSWGVMRVAKREKERERQMMHSGFPKKSPPSYWLTLLAFCLVWSSALVAATYPSPYGISVTPDQAPTASFTSSVVGGTTVSFNGSASTTPLGTITQYSWSFGDGTTATTTSPTTTHIYAHGGSYSASLTVTNSAGTSTSRVFTGQTVSNNGGSTATKTTAVTVPGPFVYVSENGGTVAPIDVATNTRGTAIAVGSHPRGVAITPDGKTAYVCNSSSNSVTPITLATNTPGTAIAVGAGPYAIAITPDGTKAYVCNCSSASVTPITLATNTAGTAIAVGAGPYSIAIDPTGTTAYVGNYNSSTISPITIATNTAGTAFTVNTPNGIAIDPTGTTAYVCNNSSNTVTPITLSTKALRTAIIELRYRHRPILDQIPDSQAILLQAWLGSRLGWKLDGVEEAADHTTIRYMYQQRPVTVVLTQTDSPIAEDGTVVSIEIKGDNDAHFLLSYEKDDTHIVVHSSSQDRCEIPYCLFVGSFQRGRALPSEVFLLPSSEHYLSSLESLSSDHWRKDR